VSGWCEPGELPPTLCVNVSTRQICREFSAHLERVLELTDFPAGRLELEITESVLIHNAERALEYLAEWKRLGLRIAVDDFGTGYSSLSYLSRLPVDRLKVDKSLVHSMTTVPRDAAIVRTVISLGRELGFTVIAEGVETAAQFEMLRDLGCQQVQGHLTARPASATETRTLLKSNWGRRLDTGRRRLRETTGSRHVQ
jgi:EAL domain-containing protein (putative c-di-GMP-specific phosphodiesterase class I)